MTATLSTRETYDAIVIGGGVGGMVAACYLARAASRTLLLEASPGFGGLAGTSALKEGFAAALAPHLFYALDPETVGGLHLARHGLRTALHDVKTIGLRPGGKHIVLPRSAWRDRAALAAVAPRDAEVYFRFKQAAFAIARCLRPLWNGEIEYPSPLGGESPAALLARRLYLSRSAARRIDALIPISAAAWLDQWFENDALKAALGFDATLGGLSPQEAGSALSLIWRHAQGSFWRRGATAQLRGGAAALALALEHCARASGVQLRSSARVASILVQGGRAQGVVLENGEAFRAQAVLSSLDSRRTLLDLVPPGGLGFGAAASVPEAAKIGFAKVHLALGALPPFAGLESSSLSGRLIVAERPESGAEAKGAALSGELAPAPIMEATVPTIADPSLAPQGAHILSVLLPLLPVSPSEGWEAMKPALLKRTLSGLESFAPGLKDRVLAVEAVTPADIAQRFAASGAPTSLNRLLAPYAQRIRTAVPGLYLCGSSAEPVDAVAGRAGRIAASIVLADLANATRTSHD